MTLTDRLQAIIAASSNHVQVAVLDKARHCTLVTNEVPMLTASVNKVAALAELLRQVDAGTVSLSDTVYVTDAYFPWGGSVLHETPGMLPDTFTLQRLAEYMIINSDNTATSVIMDTVGRASIRSMLRSIGVDDSMVTMEAYQPNTVGMRWTGTGWEYTVDGYATAPKTTAENVLRLLDALFYGDLLLPGSVATARAIMLQTVDSTRLRAGMPSGTPVAHKAGSLSGGAVTMPPTWVGWHAAPGISSDAGMVALPGFEYLIVVLTEGDSAVGTQTVREVAATVYDWIIGGKGVMPPPTAMYWDYGKRQLTPA